MSQRSNINDATANLTARFMEVLSDIKHANLAKTQEKLDQLFRLVLETVKSAGAERSGNPSMFEEVERLKSENRRLKALYATSLALTTQTQKEPLIETALDIVVRELNADAGFVVLVDEQGEIQSISSRNIEPEKQADVKEMSLSVIRSTIQSSKPTSEQVKPEMELAQQNSIIRLGISAVLCVPLLREGRVVGAVYLDRRNKENPFVATDLSYLSAFADQIVRSLKVSDEIETLEKKLIVSETTKMSDLRSTFKCAEIIGSSAALFEVLKIASRISATDATVLILGESGTGKELFAKAIHQNSRRKEKPFVAINCAAIPNDLLESELFGYEQGAFTGASKSKQGKIETAHTGTLFLDEIGEMPIALQAKLLRVLQEREFERLGSVKKQKLDIRLICATNRNLKDLVEQGKFRQDLYYRLKVVELSLPALRERPEDIEELAKHFLKKHAVDGNECTLSDEALAALEGYAWYGNVRELENVMLRCAVLATGKVISKDDLPREMTDTLDSATPIQLGKTLADAETEFRKMYLTKTLQKTSSITEAAKQLGINRTHFYKLLTQLGIPY
ncbi:MAG: sigma 54-interacting transcriptional regulator [Chloroherpetonaceae bacterium]